MNRDKLLIGLFSLARRAPARGIPPVPFGLETAVLAHWRAASSVRAEGAGMLRGLRWAALLACAFALLISALDSDELSAFRNRFEPESRVADSAIVAGYGYE